MEPSRIDRYIGPRRKKEMRQGSPLTRRKQNAKDGLDEKAPCICPLPPLMRWGFFRSSSALFSSAAPAGSS